ncbi:MAG: fluoride efflux transporter CrcB [Candidatus Limnocylindrales bacterium]
MVLVVIGLGGAAGAVARYLVDGLVTQQAASAFPFGTLVINLSGSLVLGVLFALAIERNVLPADIRAPVMVGFLGAYTTFSTLMLQSWLLVESGAIGMAILNVVGSSLLGLLAVLVGLGIGRALA